MIDLSSIISLDLSILILIFAASIYYFGRIISETKIETYDKISYYITGLIFSLIYVLIPFVIGYYSFIFLNSNFVDLLFISYIINVLYLGLLSWNIRVHEYFRRFGLLDLVEEKIKKKLSQLRSQNGIKGKLIKKYEPKLESGAGLNYFDYYLLILYKIPRKYFGKNYFLFPGSYFTFLSIFYTLSLDDYLAISVIFVMAFFLLTMIAFSWGYQNAYYPPAKIFLEDESTIEGKILKFGNYIYLIDKDKKYFVNKEKIKYIEESKFKIKDKFE